MAVDEDGSTALHVACRNGHTEVIRLLSDERADTEAIDANERTALFWSCAKGHMEVAEYLLLHKAVPNKTDRHGATPLFAAMRNGNVCYKCADCQGGDFDVCEDCFDMGARCAIGSHSLSLR